MKAAYFFLGRHKQREHLSVNLNVCFESSLRTVSSRGSFVNWGALWLFSPVLLPAKSHRQRSLVGCGPRDRLESDTTEQLHFHFSLSHIGEGNGNPLQCSCLENPRDRGAWWTALYGVLQSRTQLKWLSSSSDYFSQKALVKWHYGVLFSHLLKFR